MKWTATECLEKFESLAERTFRKRNGYSIFLRLQELAISYLRDGKYSSQAIEESFRSVFGKEIKMFNPLCADTRVAVTTTTAKDTRPCLFANYNGSSRAETSGTFDAIRPNSKLTWLLRLQRSSR